MSAGWSVAVALAGVLLGAVLGFGFTEAGGYLRRRRETTASALLILHELTYAYIAAEQVRMGFIRTPEDLRLRRVAWEAHAPAVLRAITLPERHVVGRAYSRLDDLEALLRAGVPSPGVDDAWYEANVLADLRAAAVIVARPAGQEITGYEELVEPRLLDPRDASGTD
jgi:hypothetical protein